MAEFFDYPEYAYNEKGQLKNWVAGPNPWIPAATVGLLSLLGGIEEAEGGGYGLNLDSIVDAGLLGTKTYLEGTQNLQNQRKDYYDHNLRSQQQLRENLKFQHETEDRELLKKRRRSMVEGLPNLFKELEKTNIVPKIIAKIRCCNSAETYKRATPVTIGPAAAPKSLQLCSLAKLSSTASLE